MEATLDRPKLILSQHEIVELTNGMTQPAAQLRELLRQGYVRACRPRLGPVVLTRAHYEAIQAAQPSDGRADEPAQNAPRGPNVVGLQQWANGRKQRGQKTQRR